MQIGELVALISSADAPDTCPFCGEKLHPFPKQTGRQQTTVKSKPKLLACRPVEGGGASGTWTTANHHLICARQCYAKLKPLVRMASLVGYDINDRSNGMALPTFKNPYDGALWGNKADAGKKATYGKLDPTEKQRVADWVMTRTKLQWHVGHHSFEQLIDWDVDELGEESEMPHCASYDDAVLEDLFELYDAHASQEAILCQEDEEGETDLKADLKRLSTEIKTAIGKFRSAKPWESRPYFVSQRAVKYAAKLKRRIT